MAECKLFEIPIYSMDEMTFNNRWARKSSKLRNKYSNQSYTSDHQSRRTSDFLVEINKEKSCWKYNQIVGFIVVSYSTSCTIHLDLYLHKNKIFRYNSSKKHFVHRQLHSGLHFYINNDDTNRTIVKNIEKQINFIKKEFLQKSWHVDDSAFKQISPYVDFKAIINK